MTPHFYLVAKIADDLGSIQHHGSRSVAASGPVFGQGRWVSKTLQTDVTLVGALRRMLLLVR
jgi:hypothetical protein